MSRMPDISDSKVISFDIETYDPNLTTHGPGTYRKDGYVLGVAIANEKGFSEYYSLGHYDTTSDERKKNVAYLREVFARHTNKLGANIIYDLDWLCYWQGNTKDFGFRGEALLFDVSGDLLDIQIAEPLLDENRNSYALDALAKHYLGTEKMKTDIDRFCEENGMKGDARKWLWKMPSELVAPYAKGDVELPVEIFRRQYKILKSRGLLDLFAKECELTKLLLEMRKEGVRIDSQQRAYASEQIQQDIDQGKKELFASHGNFNTNSTQQIVPIMEKLGIPVQYTMQLRDAGGFEQKPFVTSEPEQEIKKAKSQGLEVIKQKPAVHNDYLKANSHIPFMEQLYNIRKGEKLLTTFIEGSMKNHVCHDGRIHCSFHSMKTDNYGTKSGRFSSSNPNLQQVPSGKDGSKWSKVCRRLFIPLENHWWGKLDYSQIEYRFLAHYASGDGADNLRQSYNMNPDTDYHNYVMEMTSLERDKAKRVNFGTMYGMGKRSMAVLNGWDMEHAEDILQTYHMRAPYVKTTMNLVGARAIQRGHIKTILGRHAHLTDRNKSYTMLNRLMQGSAADLMKQAMIDAYREGLHKVIPFHLTVHDELDVSVPKTKEGFEAVRELKRVMENAIELKVPVMVDAEIGNNWGDVEEMEEMADEFPAV